MWYGLQILNHLDVLLTLHFFEGPCCIPLLILEVLGWHDMHAVVGPVVGLLSAKGSVIKIGLNSIIIFYELCLLPIVSIFE